MARLGRSVTSSLGDDRFCPSFFWDVFTHSRAGHKIQFPCQLFFFLFLLLKTCTFPSILLLDAYLNFLLIIFGGDSILYWLFLSLSNLCQLSAFSLVIGEITFLAPYTCLSTACVICYWGCNYLSQNQRQLVWVTTSWKTHMSFYIGLLYRDYTF